MILLLIDVWIKNIDFCTIIYYNQYYSNFEFILCVNLTRYINVRYWIPIINVINKWPLIVFSSRENHSLLACLIGLLWFELRNDSSSNCMTDHPPVCHNQNSGRSLITSVTTILRAKGANASMNCRSEQGRKKHRDEETMARNVIHRFPPRD